MTSDFALTLFLGVLGAGGGKSGMARQWRAFVAYSRFVAFNQRDA